MSSDYARLKSLVDDIQGIDERQRKNNNKLVPDDAFIIKHKEVYEVYLLMYVFNISYNTARNVYKSGFPNKKTPYYKFRDEFRKFLEKSRLKYMNEFSATAKKMTADPSEVIESILKREIKIT